MEAGSIIVTVWDKDLFKSDFLGLYEFKISEVVSHLFILLIILDFASGF